MTPVPDTERRRADIDAKQSRLGQILREMDCEWALLLMPAHVAWFTGGMNIRGLIADSERPGIFTNGLQRWLVCSNVDTQRLFEEELDGLGFQLKEWHWLTGRAGLLGEMLAGKRVAVDRPFPNLPMMIDRLRPELRVLSAVDRERYLEVGKLTAHALEATARTLKLGEREEEIAAQVAHRLIRRGAEVIGVSVAADSRSRKFRRSGYTSVPVSESCLLQVTALKYGLHATASRTVAFSAVNSPLRQDYDAACRSIAVYQFASRPGGAVAEAAEDARRVLAGGPYEYEWRQSQPGYGTGWFAAEELRRGGQEEPFVAGQAVVWQARIGTAALVDTVLIEESGPVCVTPCEGWPYKRIKIGEVAFDIPEILIRSS